MLCLHTLVFRLERSAKSGWKEGGFGKGKTYKKSIHAAVTGGGVKARMVSDRCRIGVHLCNMRGYVLTCMHVECSLGGVNASRNALDRQTEMPK